MSNQAFILGDVHAPDHDRRLWEIVMRAIEDQKPKVVLQIGDLGDWDSLSTHHARRRGTRRSYKSDKKSVRSVVSDLQASTGNGRLIFLEGNHDARVHDYLVDRAPEMEDDEDFDPRAILGLREEDAWYPYRDGVHIGKVYYTHDIGHTGVSSTRQNLVAAGHCIVTGHSHRAGVEFGGTVLGEHIFSMSVGYMGDPKKFAAKPYMPIAKMKDWQRGLGIVEYDSKWNLGFAHFAPYVRGRLVVNGKEYK